MARGWPAVSRHTRSRSASSSSRMAGSEVASSAAQARVSGPSLRKVSLAPGGPWDQGACALFIAHCAMVWTLLVILFLVTSLVVLC